MGSHSLHGLMTPTCHFIMTLAIHNILETDIHIGFFFFFFGINIGFSFKKNGQRIGGPLSTPFFCLFF